MLRSMLVVTLAALVYSTSAFAAGDSVAQLASCEVWKGHSGPAAVTGEIREFRIRNGVAQYRHDTGGKDKVRRGMFSDWITASVVNTKDGFEVTTPNAVWKMQVAGNRMSGVAEYTKTNGNPTQMTFVCEGTKKASLN